MGLGDMGKQHLAVIVFIFILSGLAFSATDSSTTATGTDKQTGFSMDKLRQELQVDDSLQTTAKTDVRPYKASGSKEVVILCLKLMFYIAIIGTLLYFILKIVRKNMYNKSGMGRGGSRNIEVLDSAALGPRKSIQLVRVAGRVLAIGVTEDTLRTLTEFNDRADVDEILKNNRPTAPGVADNFSSSINHFLSRFRKSGPRTVSSMTHDPDQE
jgi:flagellar biogenesis protein FliO